MSRDCPNLNRVQCYICKEFGHISKECPNKNYGGGGYSMNRSRKRFNSSDDEQQGDRYDRWNRGGREYRGVQEVEEAGMTSITIITEADLEVAEITTVARGEIQHGKEIENGKGRRWENSRSRSLPNAVRGNFF